jgi:hypothetical protein
MELININTYPISDVLDELLKDRTTEQNIIFATNIYKEIDSSINEKTQITKAYIDKISLQPRFSKTLKEKSERTRNKAEVFSPSWICNRMINYYDQEWFGRKNVFNSEKEQKWIISSNPITFKKLNNWQKYVNSKRLEISCGEAPFIVSRYDAESGDMIPIKERIGILDRKLRIINENVTDRLEWLEWVYKAYKSVYGYEFQGDNLLIARINLLITFVDYMQDRWERNPNNSELKIITNIIVWNFWQMDGLTGLIPFEKPKEVDCIIFDWGENEAIKYRNIKEGKSL